MPTLDIIRIWFHFLSLSALLTACASTAPSQLSPTSPPSTTTQAPLEASMTPEVREPTPAEPSQDNLDLRFANVVGVKIDALSEGEYRFDVTLYHDDDGEAPNFADAWQVADLQGNILGERELLHSHGTQPFTRSQTITIPPDIDTVLIRGHDMTHGFGGQGMRVNLNTGETTPVSLEKGP